MIQMIHQKLQSGLMFLNLEKYNLNSQSFIKRNRFYLFWYNKLFMWYQQGLNLM
ncbi:hypothetical protein TTHERM_000032859 (macronuclear) [Tetrahymena thermophila SB210]|uniref:Uncharacterized protein n=1 Tax=Tetrahymena thermophila (strain SB210) TaxID=312017 RepID=W7XKF7_TETTS|nr:hypothetical protein TTHERM_000032859 [Tetrahymena thermophila SB210]EWS74859.1 hypothetical protein TTHERM_000032859 [Tetrahymena thermophila SB210]|eukprot:XP_012652572.1 hypothetical protein TTHERM_000032859 [Tetrahymena thermophila SB210]